jgi:hypothetical protein
MTKILVILFLLSSVTTLNAQEGGSGSGEQNKSIKTPMGMSQADLEKRISKKFSIPLRKITEYEESGVRLRDLMAAAALSKASKKSIDSLFLMKQNFSNWEDLAKSLKISPEVMYKATEEIKNSKSTNKKAKASKKAKPNPN